MTADLLNASQLADKLGVKPSTVYWMARKGRIPVIKVSHKILRFDWGDVVASVKARQEKPRKAKR